MFCKYCGKGMEEGTLKCPYCGSEQGSLQATDGYFGVLYAHNLTANIGEGETEQQKQNTQKTEQLQNICKKLQNEVLSLSDINKRFRKRMNVLNTVLIVLLIGLSVAFIFLFGMQILKMEEIYKELDERVAIIESMEDTIEETKKKNEQNKEQQANSLNEAVSDFEEQLLQLKEEYNVMIQELQEENKQLSDSLSLLQQTIEEEHPKEETENEQESEPENEDE